MLQSKYLSESLAAISHVLLIPMLRALKQAFTHNMVLREVIRSYQDSIQENSHQFRVASYISLTFILRPDFLFSMLK